MSKHDHNSTTPIVPDGEAEAEEAELNPFSFREFIRHHGPDPGSEGPTGGSSRNKVHDTRKQTFAPAVETSLLWEPLHSVLRGQEQAAECGLAAAAAEEEEEEEEESNSSLWLPDEDEDEDQDKEIRRTGGGARGAEDYEGDDETTILEVTPNSFSRKSQMQQLREENMCLRQSIQDLRKSSIASEERVQQLSEELVRRRHEEEKEAQALERMVHSVEQNLHLMTKRAVKAENGISKLKQELHQFQGHMETVKSENKRLLAEQLETMTSMKHNAQMAAEYLGKTAIQAQTSIKQLLGEAENLHLVSQLLQSIDKISTHTSDIT